MEFEKYDKRLAKLGVEKPIAVEAYIMEVSAGERVHKEQDKESQKKSAVGMLKLEKSSKQAGAVVINTTFWKKCVERLSRKNKFVSSMRLKVQDKGYEGG